ncbi:MAG: phage portal protein [Planctomycetota bacterium]
MIPSPTTHSDRTPWYTAILERRLQEAINALYDHVVDPRDDVFDLDGTRWLPLGGEARGAAGMPFVDEEQLTAIRRECRALAVANEFAINGHENRISYLVGTGHLYRAVPRAGQAGAAALCAEAQVVLDEFTERNAWRRRQQEIVRRKDRDGECFLRFFALPDGLEVRFVEPDQVSTPRELAGDAAHSFGIATDAADVETVVCYYVDGATVPAAEMQHRKSNVDGNVKRGLPLFYPVRKNLRRAEKILRNMSVVSEIQSAIALIRKHAAASAASLEQFLSDQADLSTADPATGRTTHFRRYAPGTILDAAGGIDYEFPAAGIDAARYVVVLQAELRAVASRLVMPEFMLTSDASNANYASTLVAEGPAVRMFTRLQHELIDEDQDVMRRVLRHAVATGRLPRETLAAVAVQVTPPSLAVRDRLKEAQADRVLVECGAMSPATMALRHGLDPKQERERNNAPGTA